MKKVFVLVLMLLSFSATATIKYHVRYKCIMGNGSWHYHRLIQLTLDSDVDCEIHTDETIADFVVEVIEDTTQ